MEKLFLTTAAVGLLWLSAELGTLSTASRRPPVAPKTVVTGRKSGFWQVIGRSQATVGVRLGGLRDCTPLR